MFLIASDRGSPAADRVRAGYLGTEGD